ncbi:MAG: hypothetical protein J0L92_24320 [Deltaproteobacteria bacterium]|nr:hypothetical protein [Deltaproteobacteria bacterium]
MLGSSAELLFHVDPPASISKVRMLAEDLAQLAAARMGVYVDRREAQIDLLRRLRCTLEYCNDNAFSLQAPHWYLHTRGHDLEEAILAAYPKLRSYWRVEDPGRLTATILRTTADDHPRFIPRDFVLLFRECMSA